MDERPVIVAVDDEADALSTMLDALTRRFARTIVSHRIYPRGLRWMRYARSRRKGERLRSLSQTSGCPR